MKENSRTNQSQSLPQSGETLQEKWLENLGGSLESLFSKPGHDGQKLKSIGAVGSTRERTRDGSRLTVSRFQSRSDDPLSMPRWILHIESSNRLAVSSNGEIKIPESVRSFEHRNDETGTHLYQYFPDGSEVMASEEEGAELQHFVDELDELASNVR